MGAGAGSSDGSASIRATYASSPDGEREPQEVEAAEHAEVLDGRVAETRLQAAFDRVQRRAHAASPAGRTTTSTAPRRTRQPRGDASAAA